MSTDFMTALKRVCLPAIGLTVFTLLWTGLLPLPTRVSSYQKSICRTCGNKLTASSRQFAGITWSSQKRIQTTAVSLAIAQDLNSTCPHDWHLAYNAATRRRNGGSISGHGRTPALDLIDNVPFSKSLRAIARTNAPLSREIWTSLFDIQQRWDMGPDQRSDLIDAWLFEQKPPLADWWKHNKSTLTHPTGPPLQ